MHTQLSIHFGPFVLAISSTSPTLYTYLEQFFNGYICNNAPDFTIEVLPADNLPNPIEQMTKSWIPLKVDGNRFDIGPQIITGLLNFRENTISISMRDDFFSFPTANVFQEFLYRLYYTLCRQKSTKSCFIHGCGVIRDNRGYLFIGPHQSGKTTIGQLSKATVIHDDQILLTYDGTTLTMDSPPFAAKDTLRCHPANPYALDKIFVIIQDTTYAINPLDAQAALVKLYNEIILPITLVSNNQKEALKQKASACFDIAKQVTLYELRFDKAGMFWEHLACI